LKVTVLRTHRLDRVFYVFHKVVGKIRMSVRNEMCNKPTFGGRRSNWWKSLSLGTTDCTVLLIPSENLSISAWVIGSRLPSGLNHNHPENTSALW